VTFTPHMAMAGMFEFSLMSLKRQASCLTWRVASCHPEQMS